MGSRRFAIAWIIGIAPTSQGMEPNKAICQFNATLLLRSST